MRQELSSPDARKFSTSPWEPEVCFPLGNPPGGAAGPSGPSTTQKAECPRPGPSRTLPRGMKRHREPSPPAKGIFMPKYNTENQFIRNVTSKDDIHDNLPPNMQTKFWLDVFISCQSAELAENTWKKYRSAFNCWKDFSETCETNLSWPISSKVVNGFVLWCVVEKKLKPDTIRSYIMAMSHLQKIKGKGRIKLSHSVADSLIEGASNIPMVTNSNSYRPGAVTFNRLIKIHKNIWKQTWGDGVALSVWACAITVFFGSFRMGELLAPSVNKFDSSATLLWSDVKVKKNFWHFHIKRPKSRNPKGEFVFLFPFHYQIFVRCEF